MSFGCSKKARLRARRATSGLRRGKRHLLNPESLESRVLFAEIAGTLLVDLNATTLTPGSGADNVPNTGTLGGVFRATDGGTTVPVAGRPVLTATGGTSGIYLDGNDFLRLVNPGTGETVAAPAGISGVDPTTSIEAWVWNPSLAGEETMVAWGRRGADGNNMSFNYGNNPDYGAMGHWGPSDLGWGTTPPAARQWHHLVYTYDGSVQRVYVDGVQSNFENLTPGTLNILATAPIQIGSQTENDGVTATADLRGKLTLGRVRIHDGVLTATQVLANYNSEKAQFVEPVLPPPPPLVKLVDVDPTALPEGTADNIVNTGTLGGSFRATGDASTVPVIDQPLSKATGGTKGIRLDGTDYLQHVDSDGNLFAAPAAITGADPKTSIEVWAWNTAIAGEETMVSWGHRGGPDGSNMSFNYGDDARWGAMGHWGEQDMGWGATAPAARHWHHLVYTYDGNTQRVYVDGTLANSELLGEGALNIWSGPPINIGTQMNNDGSQPQPDLRGRLTLGRVRVYSGIMTDAQVAADYNNEKAAYVEPVLPPPVPLTKLVDVDATALPDGTFPFIANTGTLGGFFSATGGGDTTPTIGRPLSSATGGTRGIRLDGNDFLQLVSNASDPNSIITAPASITGVDPMQSVEAWVYNPGVAGEEAVVSWGKRGGPDGSNASFNYGSNGTWGAVGRWGNPDFGWGQNYPAGGQWHHLAYTYDGITSRVYVDGVQTNIELLNEGDVNTTPDTAISIGTQLEPNGTTPTPTLRGSLTVGKLRIYSGVLTPNQIVSNYNGEKAAFVNPTGLPAATALTSAPIHRYSFNNAAGTADTGVVVKDLVGNADATVLGAGATFNGSRLVLPGGASATAAYVDLPNGILSGLGAANPGGTGQVTLEGWVRHTGLRDWSRIYDFGSSTAGDLPGPGGTGTGQDFVMLTAQTGADPIHRFETTDLGNPNSRWDEVTGALNQDLHFAFTWNETTGERKYYENGKEVGSLPGGGVLLSDITDINNWLGRSQFTGDGNFQGEYDEFRIYNRVLSPGEVLGDFQAGANVVNTAAAPTVSAFTVNDGDAQRSQVTKLAVKFSAPGVTLATGAVKLMQLTTDVNGNLTGASTDQSALLVLGASTDGGQTFSITFNTPDAHSLPDGVYQLVIDHTKVSNATGAMAADYTSPKFHRLFGDKDGNGAVGAVDYAAFRAGFGKFTGETGYFAYFDYTNDGAIGALDYAQFRNRFGKAFNFTP
jgi:hypothetical protein